MYDESSVELVREAILVSMKIAAPIVLAGMVVGLLISLVQSITSIQDQTVSLVPKIAAMLLVAVLLVPWIMMRLVEYAADLFRLVS
ncbi:MAG: flagellar biosynthetic protein FliQ [Phycisphaerales bacterium]|jgi:flagellar biosynthetic protein FliQ